MPLHEHVIAQGFLDYVKSRGDGPLFYNPDERVRVSADTTKPRTPRASQARDDLREWTRSLGIVHREVQPTHGWRHTFKQRAARYDILDRFSDAITGHVPKTEGGNYGAPTLLDMENALRKFPRYEV